MVVGRFSENARWASGPFIIRRCRLAQKILIFYSKKLNRAYNYDVTSILIPSSFRHMRLGTYAIVHVHICM